VCVRVCVNVRLTLSLSLSVSHLYASFFSLPSFHETVDFDLRMAEGSGEDWEWGDQRNGMHDQRAAGVTKRSPRMVGSCRRPDFDVVQCS
jgi:hypothetical protein